MGPFLTLFCSRIQQRWVFAIMASLAVVFGYAMRVCLSITITGIVKPVETPVDDILDEEACPADSNSSMASNFSHAGIYEWDEYTQGIILSSFYWGNFFTQIPGGLLAVKYGGKYVLGGSLLGTGILTLLTPSAIEVYGSTGLMGIRFMIGSIQGLLHPAVGDMIGQWAPPQERTKIATIVSSGMPIGTVMGTALSGILIQHSSIGWPLVFYFFGTCAIVWYFAWVVLCHSYPEEHPFITEKEKSYLKEAMSQHTQRERQPTPWREMMASGPLRAMLVAHCGFSWGFFMMISDLPKYMSSVLKFSIELNGFLSALPHLVTWIVGNAASWPADWFIRSNKASRTTVRKVLNTSAAVLSAAFLVAASYAECNRVLVVFLFTLGLGSMGFYYPSVVANMNDLSPNYSGLITSCATTVAALSGMVAPFVVGVLTPHQTFSEWRNVFWITFAVIAGSSSIFAVWGDGEVQQWNDPEPQDPKQVKFKNGTAKVFDIEEIGLSRFTTLHDHTR